MPTITIQAGRNDVRAVLARIPAILAGREPDPAGLVRSLQLRLGVALLSKVQQAFIAKSRGQTGDDGIKWAPLRRATIAQRRSTAAERKGLGVGGKRTRGLLTPAEDKRWRRIFALTVARLMLRGVGRQQAQATAGKVAWAALKAQGARTKLDVLGGRTVDIGRDTGVLFRSLSPGVEDKPSNADGQVFDAPSGRVIVGTNVPYAEHFHRQRPLWPDRLPEAWWDYLRGVAARGVVRLTMELLKREFNA